MNHCGIQQNGNFSSFGNNNGEPVICPKPVKPLRWHMCYQQEPYEPSSPPYFCGSPPSRVSNPLIQDARFGDEKVSQIPSNPNSVMLSSIRTSYGNKPSVRIEGFNCLDRGTRRNCSVAALA